MADSILEVLSPHLDSNGPPPPSSSRTSPSLSTDATALKYMNRLTTLSLDSLKSTEPQSISHSAHSTLLSLQALSNRSHKAFIASSDHLSNLQGLIPSLSQEVKKLQNEIPKLDEEAVRFSTRYSKAGENPVLDRRRKAMQLSRNVDRISDILELPALLSTAVSSSAAASGPAAGSLSTNKYSTALDLYSHIKRLQTLYPDSPLVNDIVLQAEDAMKDMTTNLITGLRAQNIRLAAAMRTVGWLRRVAPELENPRGNGGSTSDEGAFGALFLVCRLASLVSTLEALDPLRELADQETKRRTEAPSSEQRSSNSAKTNAWSGGQQTERFLKRYIEIYREQSFAIVSLYKNIFTTEPSSDTELITASISGLKTQPPPKQAKKIDPLQTLPPTVATFPIHLVRLLTDTLRTYLPNVRDKSSRESLLTQVLYCAASLGRLGGDFSMILTELEAEDEEEGEDEESEADGELVREWEQVMRKHRALAGKLEQLTNGPSSAANATKGLLPVSS
ncbi:Dor1-like family-domain-containing protein [Talaromyces proteolyticus]|uniref:Conserved oligomeric Golgi complex subunit 8 n=1 Tax=Talaromyces proteolyticus TaxID=1131652 RepID=A0AAD4PZ42_9EURO|nr:Dor1-like family-domain-containing protein [Talaromyces proteolyticus]KAH8695382.1 Dor1-like family-domain-containing protein [Talaromyces proteolyticus]